MSISTLCFTVAIAHLVVLGLAIPVLSDIKTSIVPRNQVCANAPATKAGNTFERHILPRRSLPVVPSLADLLADNPYMPVIWCARGTKTYVILTLVRPLNSRIVLSLLDDAYSTILGHIALWGDSVVDGGLFTWAGAEGLMLNTRNTNNHQMTWGVLAAAINALGEYMHQAVTGPGEASFSVFDGQNEVGAGTIMLG